VIVGSCPVKVIVFAITPPVDSFLKPELVGMLMAAAGT
jgi:hypothetical protein